jgi:hypothetical protein
MSRVSVFFMLMCPFLGCVRCKNRSPGDAASVAAAAKDDTAAAMNAAPAAAEARRLSGFIQP